MLKKLRNKLLLFNMIALGVVIAASFAAIFVLQYQHMRGIDEDRLASIPSDAITNAMLAERQYSDGSGDAAAADGADAAAADASDQSEDADAEGTLKAHIGQPFIDNAGPNLAIDYSNLIVMNEAGDGTLTVFSRMELTEDDYISAAEAVMKKAGSAGGSGGILVKTDGTGTTVTTGTGSRSLVGDIRFDGSHWLYSYKAVGTSESSMVLMNIDATDRAMARLLTSMIIIGGCVIAGLFLISLLFSNRAIRPAEEGLRRQRQFVADASHELKTPLAIIDANAEAALAEPSDAGLWLGRIGEESGRMRGLIDDLLFLARSEDAADIPMEKLPVDLAALAESEAGRIEAVLFERDIRLELARPSGDAGSASEQYAYGTAQGGAEQGDAQRSGSVVVNADPARVRQVLLILLDNAMKYTDRGGRITVETGRSRKYGYIKVTNTGAGIDPGDLPRVFDRFYRADKARTSGQGSGADAAHGGYGLGLSIARAITERAGGRIAAESADGKTTFTVELPL